MEIDELKKIWNETPEKGNLNTRIMEIIQNQTYGPLESLRAAYRRQIVLMSIIPVLLVMSNFNDIDKILTSVLFWAYVAFCICIVTYARMNLNIVAKMQQMDKVVKANLEQQVILLEKRTRLEIVGLRVVLAFFIVLVEMLPYFQHYRMLDKWNSLNVFIRFGAYAGIALLQYVLTKNLKERKVGRHIKNLKQLASQLQ
jgi:hypothetical protein